MQQNARQRGPWFLDQGGGDGLIPLIPSTQGAGLEVVQLGCIFLVTFVAPTQVAERHRLFWWQRCLWPLGLQPLRMQPRA